MIPLMTDLLPMRYAAALASVCFVVGGALGAAMFTPTPAPAPLKAEFCAEELSTLRMQDEHIDQLRKLHTQLTQQILLCQAAPVDCSSEIAKALAEQARLRCAICKSKQP